MYVPGSTARSLTHVHVKSGSVTVIPVRFSAEQQCVREGGESERPRLCDVRPVAVLGCTAPLPGAPSESPPTGPRSRAGCASSPAWLWAVSRLVCRQNARLGHLLLVRLKVLLVEVVYPDVAVLAAGGVRAAVRREGERVDGAEVASDAAELLPEGVVEEERLELALRARGRARGWRGRWRGGGRGWCARGAPAARRSS